MSRVASDVIKTSSFSFFASFWLKNFIVYKNVLLLHLIIVSYTYKSLNSGGSLPHEIEEGQPVAIYAEGKQNALAVGITKMSTASIKDVNKGIGVDNVHYLMDGLWFTPTI